MQLTILSEKEKMHMKIDTTQVNLGACFETGAVVQGTVLGLRERKKNPMWVMFPVDTKNHISFTRLNNSLKIFHPPCFEMRRQRPEAMPLRRRDRKTFSPHLVCSRILLLSPLQCQCEEWTTPLWK